MALRPELVGWLQMAKQNRDKARAAKKAKESQAGGGGSSKGWPVKWHRNEVASIPSALVALWSHTILAQFYFLIMHILSTKGDSHWYNIQHY